MMNKLVATIGATIFMLSVGTTAAEAQHGADDVVPHARHGADDPTGHDTADDHGRRHGGRGADEAVNHDANDDHGHRHGGHGADD